MFDVIFEVLKQSGPYTGPVAIILFAWLWLERKERIAAQAARIKLLEDSARDVRGLADAAAANYARQSEALDRLERAVSK